MKTILLGILTWNHYKIAKRCLKSVKKHTKFRHVQLIIIDNGSDDPETLKWLDDCDVDILRLKKNYGIVGGMRRGFDYAFTLENIEYVCFLNCDTLVTDNWLGRLADIMPLNENLIAVSPKDNNDYVCYQHFNIPLEHQPVLTKGKIGEFESDSKFQKYINTEFYPKRKHPSFKVVENLDPPAALWRKKYVQELGNFSEEFDGGLGVMELFIRAQKEKGYELAYCLSSFIYHAAHGAAGKYDGFLKTHGGTLNDWVNTKMGEIRVKYDVDLPSYGHGELVRSDEVLNTEKELIKL